MGIVNWMLVRLESVIWMTLQENRNSFDGLGADHGWGWHGGARRIPCCQIEAGELVQCRDPIDCCRLHRAADLHDLVLPLRACRRRKLLLGAVASSGSLLQRKRARPSMGDR